MSEVAYKKYFLKPGFIYLTAEPTVITTVLGSCIAVTLFDKKNKIGGMNHFVHPVMSRGEISSALYAKPATLQLLKLFQETGAFFKTLEAQIFGGATHPEATGELATIGERNKKIAEDLLTKFGVRLIGQEVGGYYGRKILFNTMTGEIMIAKVEKIRQTDWYPAEADSNGKQP